MSMNHYLLISNPFRLLNLTTFGETISPCLVALNLPTSIIIPSIRSLHRSAFRQWKEISAAAMRPSQALYGGGGLEVGKYGR